MYTWSVSVENMSSRMLIISMNFDPELQNILGDVVRGKALDPRTSHSSAEQGWWHQPTHSFFSKLTTTYYW